MEQDILMPDKTEIDNYQETDVFQWANNLVQYKDELKIELFLINKNYIPYKTTVAKELHKQLEPLFIDNILEFVLQGTETGLIVRGFEEAEDEEGVLQRTQLFKVDKARETLNWIKTQFNELEVFNEAEHDFRRIKGMVARISHKDIEKPFFVIKTLPKSNTMSGRVGWMVREGRFVAFDADAVLRIPEDNQLLVLDQDMYVFNQARLKQMFGYDAKEASIAEQKINEINHYFKLTFPEGITLQKLVMGKKSTIKKLQKIVPAKIKQQDIVDHAEELDLDLMVDDAGAIIISEPKDLDVFVNLLNDDYIESALTGEKYEIIRKRPLKISSEDSQL